MDARLAMSKEQMEKDAEEKRRLKEEVVCTPDERGREALSALAPKFTKRPRTGKLIINVNEGRVARVHFEPSDK